MKIPFRLTCLLLLLASCNRDLEPITKSTYDVITIGGVNVMDSVATLNVMDSDSISLFVYFSLMTGDPAKDTVIASISGLPGGVSISRAAYSGTLPASWSPTFHIQCDTGTYTFDVNLKTISKGQQSFPVKLHVLPPANDAVCLAGTWNSEECGGTGSCTSTITTIDSQRHWAIIKNVSCLGDSISVYAFVSEKTGITIPTQTSHGYTIYGRTSFFPCPYQTLSLSIPDTIIHNGDTQRCYLYLRTP